MYLAECCRTRQVHMIVRHNLGPGMSDYLSARIRATPNITLHEGKEIAAVHGERLPRSIDLKVHGNGEIVASLPVGAIFVFIGADPHVDWLPDSLARDKLGYLLTGADAAASGRWPLTNREPVPLETTIPGVLAAGDVRAGSTKRVGFAVGDGSLAVTCVHRLRSIRSQ
jgi:thioredoxin reductase (NADPH)